MHQDIQEELLIKNSYISFLITQGAFMQTALLLLQKTFNIWRQI